MIKKFMELIWGIWFANDGVSLACVYSPGQNLL